MKFWSVFLGWLKKYAVWIAVIQAVVWPTSIVYDKLYPWGIEVSRPEMVVNSMLQEWHVWANTLKWRSRDACEWVKEHSTEDYPYKPKDCRMYAYESTRLKHFMAEYSVEEYSDDRDWILKQLYFSNGALAPSVKEEFGGFVDEVK